jgi:hypothetical protein
MVALCVHGINKKYCKSCLNSKKPAGHRKGTREAGPETDPNSESKAE